MDTTRESVEGTAVKVGVAVTGSILLLVAACSEPALNTAVAPDDVTVRHNSGSSLAVIEVGALEAADEAWARHTVEILMVAPGNT